MTSEKPTISEFLKEVIRKPDTDKAWKAGKKGKTLFFIVRELLRAGIEPEKVVAIISDHENGISEYVYEKGGVRYARWRVARTELFLQEFTRDDKGNIIKNAHNVRVALAKLCVDVSYSEFDDRTFVEGLRGFGPTLDDAAIDRIWLAMLETLGFNIRFTFMRTVIADEARTKYKFHPVLDYLNGLEWDGVERLDEWLTTYAGAVPSDYVKAVGAIVLIAAVRRVRQPGSKFDEMLVLESPTQGTEKSTALSVLAVKPEWFTDHFPLTADPKVVMEQTRGKWIVECAELSGSKGDIDKIKGTLSRTYDRARLAYGRLTTEWARQWISIGTTNSQQYLKDQTGNRRWWPVPIVKLDVAALKRDRDQLWAEAAHREANGEPIRLDPSLWAAAGIEQAARTTSDPYYDILVEHLDGIAGDLKIRVSDLWIILGNPKAATITLDQSTRLSDCMRRLGWRGNTVSIKGEKAQGYVKGTGPPWITVETTLIEAGRFLLSVGGKTPF